MKLKVGDIVRIKSHSELEPLAGSRVGEIILFPSMTAYCGEKMRIVGRTYVTKIEGRLVLTDSPWCGKTPVYRLENCFYCWSEKMFEAVNSLRYEVE